MNNGPDAAPVEERRRTPGTRFRDCPECPEMVVAPAGSFMMGSPWWEIFRWPCEGPVHEVTMAHPFAVGVYEVTFEEWDACVSGGGCGGYQPDDAGWGRGRRPVVNVSWEDAKAYVEWLSGKTGEGYRLLSESEWEYVARSGTDTRYFWWGDEIGLNRANGEACVEFFIDGRGEDAQMHARWEGPPLDEKAWDGGWPDPEAMERDSRWRDWVMWAVSWEQAQRYVEWLSRKTGEGYRLLLLKAWEWDEVAHAGTGTGHFWWGNESGGRNRANCGAVFAEIEGGAPFAGPCRTTPVGSFPANPFGLYDVHGNVWELVEDRWHDTYHGAPSDGSAWESGKCGKRVMRGGSWRNDAPDLRSARRESRSTSSRGNAVGFRVARTLTDPGR